jgi:hypothetical protein
LPDGVRSRGDITDFLGEQADSGRFFTRQADNQSGEAEAITAAEGADSTTDPLPGAGRIEPGDATEFVEVARPARTEIDGEPVPMQFFRQNTADATPLRQQRGEVADFFADDRGQMSLSGTGRRTSRRRGSSLGRSDQPYTPGGRSGTPLSPISASGASSPFASELEDVDSSPGAAGSPSGSSPGGGSTPGGSSSPGTGGSPSGSSPFGSLTGTGSGGAVGGGGSGSTTGSPVGTTGGSGTASPTDTTSPTGSGSPTGGGGGGSPTTGGSPTGSGFGSGFGSGTATEDQPRGRPQIPGDEVDLEDEGDVLLGEQDDLFGSGIAEAEDILTPGSN